MSNVEIIHEPQPGAKGSGKIGGEVKITLIDSKTGEQVGSTKGDMQENERRERIARKY